MVANLVAGHQIKIKKTWNAISGSIFQLLASSLKNHFAHVLTKRITCTCLSGFRNLYGTGFTTILKI